MRLPYTKYRCALGDLVLDCINSEFKTDFSILNSGSITGSIADGQVIDESVSKTILKFEQNMVVTFQWTGAELLSELEFLAGGGNDASKYKQPQIGGVKFTYSSAAPVGSRVKSATVNGASLDPAKVYNIAANDYDIGKGYYIRNVPTSAVNTQKSWTSSFTECMKKKALVGFVSPSVDGRITAI